MAGKTHVPAKPEGMEGLAVVLDVELQPIPKDDLPVQWVQVLPVGAVRIRDYRENFEVERLSVLEILFDFAADSVEMPFDYAHGMWYGEDDRASGWGERMRAVVPAEWVEPLRAFIGDNDRVEVVSLDDEHPREGLFVFVRWTLEAAEAIRRREYRYLSPVLFFDHAGRPNHLWNVALVNNPAIDGMLPLAASVLRPAVAAAADTVNTPGTGAQRGDEMDVKAFGEALGLGEVSTEHDIVEAFGKTRAEREALAQAVADGEAKIEALHAQIVARDEQLAAVDTDRKAALAKLEELTERTAVLEASAREHAVDAAVRDGLLAASQRGWALEHFAAFETLLPTLEGAPTGPPQGQVTAGHTVKADVTGNDRSALHDAAKELAKAEGIDYLDAVERLRRERAAV